MKRSRWDRERVKLKRNFLAAGITECELRYPGCWQSNALSFAHAVKRRFLSENAEAGSPEHVATVILACTPCHDSLERNPNMKQTVIAVIESR